MEDLVYSNGYGGQLKKSSKVVLICLNTFNNLTYTDSTNNTRLGFNLATLETGFLLKNLMYILSPELGDISLIPAHMIGVKHFS